jgi:gamma-polyglutamate biosynthesis protein CapA
MKFLYALIFILVLGLGGFLTQKAAKVVQEFELPESQYGRVAKPFVNGSILFGGDIMLGRSVETLMDEKGAEFPFEHIKTTVGEHTLAIANFEAAVPEVHEKTLPNTMRFSVEESNLSTLSSVGFDVLSLSNNHALDHGTKGYTHTKAACERNNVVCVGHPTNHTLDSIHYANVGDTVASFLTLHTLFEKVSTTTLKELVETMRSNSSVQYVFIHWGEEYKRIHSANEKELAHFLIDEGIDAVVGHHPHVMQDVELYNGKPIFYSLGNLIFDQYFSEDVQEGYFVSAHIEKDAITYTLLPYDTHAERSQPKLQSDPEKRETVHTLLQYPIFTDTEIANASFEVQRD